MLDPGLQDPVVVCIGILVCIFKYKTSWNATIDRFNLKKKIELTCRTEGGLEVRLVARIRVVLDCHYLQDNT